MALLALLAQRTNPTAAVGVQQPCAGCSDAAVQPPALRHLPSHSHTAATTQTCASPACAPALQRSAMGMERGTNGERSDRRAEQQQEPKGQQGSTMEPQQRSTASSVPLHCNQHCGPRDGTAQQDLPRPLSPALLRGSAHSPGAGQPHLLTACTP